MHVARGGLIEAARHALQGRDARAAQARRLRDIDRANDGCDSNTVPPCDESQVRGAAGRRGAGPMNGHRGRRTVQKRRRWLLAQAPAEGSLVLLNGRAWREEGLRQRSEDGVVHPAVLGGPQRRSARRRGRQFMRPGSSERQRGVRDARAVLPTLLGEPWVMLWLLIRGARTRTRAAVL
jgi:hypothetical protein